MLLLLEAAGALLATPHSDVVLGRVMDAAAHLVKADAYAVWQRNNSTHEWCVATTRGLLLDLLATGDRAGVDAAAEQAIALYDAWRATVNPSPS